MYRHQQTKRLFLSYPSPAVSQCWGVGSHTSNHCFLSYGFCWLVYTDHNLINTGPAIVSRWLLIHSREDCDSHVTHQHTHFDHTYLRPQSDWKKKKSQEGVSGEEYYKGYKSFFLIGPWEFPLMLRWRKAKEQGSLVLKCFVQLRPHQFQKKNLFLEEAFGPS